jgi:hypothetical protein
MKAFTKQFFAVPIVVNNFGHLLGVVERSHQPHFATLG